MSLRIDTSEPIVGALEIGNTGLGVLGSQIASAGDNGAGYAYNDLSLPADASKEICGRVTTWPTHGTLFAYEDTSFTYTSTGNLADSFAYQLYVDGVATGSPTTVALYPSGTSASTDATASGGLPSLSVVAPQGNASSGVSASASGAMPSISVTALTGVASATANASASGAMPTISIISPAGSANTGGDVTASGGMPAIAIHAPSATASATADAVASGSFPAIMVVAPHGVATTLTSIVTDANRMHATLRLRSLSAGYSYIMPPSYTSFNRYQPAKRSTETEFFSVDFSSLLADQETITTATVTCQVTRGVDANPSAMVSGSAIVSGSIVSQKITAGVSGCTYALIFQVTTSNGVVLEDVKLLQVSDAVH